MGRAGIIILDKEIDGRSYLVRKIISTEPFIKVGYSSDGVITSFEFPESEGSLEKVKFKRYIYKTIYGKFVYYVNEIDLREYSIGLRTLEQVRRYEKFESAKAGDSLKIYKRILNSAIPSFCYQAFEWNLVTDNDEIIYNERSKEVIPPETAIASDPNCDILNSAGFAFFQFHVTKLFWDFTEPLYYSGVLIEGDLEIADHEKDEANRLIADIAYKISRTDSDVFNAFDGGNPYLSIDWEEDAVSLSDYRVSVVTTVHTSYKLTTLEALKAYKKNISKFYNNFQNNLLIIEGSSNIARITKLAVGMQTYGLRFIGVEKKIKILKYLIDEKLETAFDEFLSEVFESDEEATELEMYENFVVKLCASFDESHLEIHNPDIDLEDTHIDFFLNAMQEYVKEGVTLYEALFDRMSTSWNITEILMTLSNWVFETDFEPKNTRDAFVQIIYGLWQMSKFNPYEIVSGDLKSEVIGTKILDESDEAKVKFDNENDEENQGKLFYYSHEMGLDFTNEYIVESDVELPYTYWGPSHYNKHFVKWQEASPIVLPYKSYKFLGIFSNNFSFEIEGKEIKAYQNVIVDYDIVKKRKVSVYNPVSSFMFYGKYKLFQPVSLLNVDVDSKTPIATTTGNSNEINGQTINSVIPLFVLHYINDSNDRNNAEKMLGYFVDGALTFSGIGNLAKLKHLKWFGLGTGQLGLLTKQGLRIILGAVEFTSGVLGYFANFVECDEEDSFCKHMKEFITLFEVAASVLSVGDSIATLVLKKRAGKLIEEAGGGVNDAELVTNLKDKLRTYPSGGSTVDDIDEAAEKIVDLGKNDYNNFLAKLLELVEDLYKKIRKKLLRTFESYKNGEFHLDYFLSEFTEIRMKQIIRDFLDIGINDEKTIHDFLLMCCRGSSKKKYSYEEARVIIKYCAFVLKRGFVTGFSSLADYKLFSKRVKIYLDDYCQQFGIKGARYEIQGSVQFKSHPDDPNVDDLPVLTRNGEVVGPDDLDGRIYISQEAAVSYLEKVREYWKTYYRNKHPDMNTDEIKDLVDKTMQPILKKADKGFIPKTMMPPPKEYYDGLLDVIKKEDGTSLFYPKNSKNKTDVGFSIIIEGSSFDIDPVFPLNLEP